MKNLLTLLALTSACGNPEVYTPEPKKPIQIDSSHVEVDPRFEAEFLTFLTDCEEQQNELCARNLKKLKVVKVADEMPEFDGKTPNTIGICSRNRAGFTVWIKSSIEPGSLSSFALMYHELGHCLLDLSHAGEGEISLMRPKILQPDETAGRWERLKNELFSRANTSSSEYSWGLSNSKCNHKHH